jgi:hypothetical protein
MAIESTVELLIQEIALSISLSACDNIKPQLQVTCIIILRDDFIDQRLLKAYGNCLNEARIFAFFELDPNFNCIGEENVGFKIITKAKDKENRPSAYP